jgi:hypothetical protein
MTELEIAWLAGLLEGEGNFELVPAHRCGKRRSMEVRLNLSMTDLDVVERVAKLVEATAKIWTNDRSKQSGTRPNHKPLYCLSIKGYRAIRIMTAILPFMGERRSAKIREAIDAWNAVAHTRERNLPPTCHPDLPHYSKGLCRACYKRSAWATKKDERNRVRREKYALTRASAEA